MTAPAELVIEVTAQDIAAGKPGNVCQSPVALATLRALGEWTGFLKVEIDHAGLQISLFDGPDFGDPCAFYPLPDGAVAWVERFDDGRPVEPFTFTARREDGDPS